MANTYSQLHIHCIFAVKGRQSLIPTKRNNELQKYITGIVRNRKHKMIAVNNMPDHVHLFIGLHPDQSLSALMRDVKAVFSKFINEKNWLPGKFSWQEGFGAFSYSHSQIDRVVRYIMNQEKHHAKKAFRDEYLEFLRKFDVPFDEQYLFDWIE